MNTTIVTLAFLTGILAGAAFQFFKLPIPAPPNLAGIMGIVGIYVGYLLIGHLGIGFDIVDALGL